MTEDREARNLGRLLVFFDEPFYRAVSDGQETITTNRAFWLFIRAIASSFAHVYFLARVCPEPRSAPFSCAPDRRFTPIELPYYESLYSLKAFLRTFPAQCCVLWRAVGSSDVILLGVPHPTSAILWLIGRLRGRPVIFLDRQDLIIRAKLRSAGLGGLAAVVAAQFLVWLFVQLSRWTLTFAVGGEMYRRYARLDSPVHELLISLVPEASLAKEECRAAPPVSVPVRLLWVGRIDPDKGLEVLLHAVKELVKGNPARRWELDLVGSGSIENEIARTSAELDLEGVVTLRGFVPFGPSLDAFYDRATVYVLPSNESEGFPQVIIEAMARGLPVVATAVAGIPYALRDEETALLVPPREPVALAAAIERLVLEPGLYERCSAGGLGFARAHTLEAQREAFLNATAAWVQTREVAASTRNER